MVYLGLLLGLFLTALITTTPLTLEAQMLFGATAVVMALVLMRRYSELKKIIFAALVVAVSGRYLYWRITETLSFQNSLLEYILGCGMFAAEIYFLIILAGSYIQNIAMRQRKPENLPDDISLWPTVDIYIPTYNEPLDIVEVTVIAAKSIDWPRDKVNIYLLDDGRRQEFRQMAAKQGIGYLTRNDNKGAKAGNLNNALRHTKGELITIFDCDHVPTRSFLQLTVGWFVRDRKLALIQTPHHFYNDDPFEKNLHTGKESPNEGLLFYGMVQDGNDFWNASFFCGSCAILRRTAIYEVGGFATETVTEDAHTSLRLHQKGWNSAFLKIPQASGLATGSLRAHIGQRLRWGRGMLQIFRTENPFISPGLSFAQSFCYANAMLHFLFSLPRIVLLTAPLAYLLLDVRIIVASPQDLIAYALPHIVVAVMASLYLQSRFRQIFMTEVYETALAFHLLGPTLLTLINPKLGKFNVTDKQGANDDTYFDWKIIVPQLLTTLLMITAVAYALFNIFTGRVTGDDLWSTVLNIVWASISIGILTLATAVGLEKGERRRHHRVTMNREVTLQTDSGHTFKANLKDMSLNGASFSMPDNIQQVQPCISDGSSIYVNLPYSHSSINFRGEVLRMNEESLHILFTNQEDKEQLNNRIKALFGRADAWINWDNLKEHGFISSWWSMNKSMMYFLGWCLKAPFSRSAKNVAGESNAVSADNSIDNSSKSEPRTLRKLGSLSQIGSLAFFLIMYAMLISPNQAIASDLYNLKTELSGDTLPTREYMLQLKDVGVTEPILLKGSDSSRFVAFSLRSDEVVSAASMKLRLSVSPGLDPQNSQLSVVINGEIVHSVILNSEQSGIDEIEFDISPYVMLQDNSMEFRVIAQKLGQDVDNRETNKSIWVQISNSSALSLNVNRLPLSLNLNNLPAPFFDRRDHAELVLPFSFSRQPTKTTVEAASIVASYWGSLASFRRASFPILFSELPSGNGIIFLTNTSTLSGLENVEIAGPSLEIVANPRDPLGQLLLIKGRDDIELLAAAKALSMGNLLVSGSFIDVAEPIQQPRDYYDAPSWLPSNRPATFGEIEETASLEGYGLSPGLLTVNFKMAPDIFLWNSKGVPVNLNFRHPGSRWFDLENSRLDALINDKFIASIPLNDIGKSSFGASDFVQSTWRFTIPPYLIYGENQLQFYFDLKTKVSEQNDHLLPTHIRVAIDPDSSIDLSSAYRYSRMPNLAYLAQSGLPFSRKADLSETVVIAPKGGFDPLTLQALLTLVGTIGSKTEYPALGIKVIDAQQVDDFPNHDLLLLGSFDNQPLLQRLSEVSPIKFDQSYLSIAHQSPLSQFRYKFKNLFSEEKYVPDRVVVPRSNTISAFYSHQSPFNPQKTVVGLIANKSQGLVDLANALKSAEKSASIKGDFFVVNEQEVLSFATSEPYFVGYLPWHVKIQWYILSNVWLIPLLLIGGVFVLALSAFILAKRRAERLVNERKPFDSSLSPVVR